MGYPAAAALLLDRGADIEARDNEGGTALHQLLYAGYVHSPPTIALLLSRGADVEARNNIGETPLLMAVVNSDWNVVKLLLEAGADVSVKSPDGATPCELARNRMVPTPGIGDRLCGR